MADEHHLQQRIEVLERENRLLREGMQQAGRMRRLWEEALDDLKRAKETLEQRNHQLSSLYRVASAITHTLEVEELVETFMDVMEDALGLEAPCPMGVFLVAADDTMRLVGQRGGSPEFVQAHQGMRVGDCLCGMAAQGHTEAVVVPECSNDPRHTILYPGLARHAHLILPLRAKDRVVGVFYYYLPPGYAVEPEQRDTFSAIASQFGLATENARLYAAARDLSTHDALTGLGNRRLMELQLDRSVEHARRYEAALSVLMLDIDYFKRYNDEHGHLEGDRLLVEVARTLRHELRGADLAVRYGGEEFLVLLPHTEREGAVSAAERIRRAVAGRTPATVSVGVYSLAGESCTPERLIHGADAALYRAKAAGRDRVRYGPSPGPEAPG